MDWDQIRREREEYFESLNAWMEEARRWYNFPLLGDSLFPDGYNNNIINNIGDDPFPTPVIPHFLQENDPVQPPVIPLYQTYPLILPPNILRLPTTYEFKIPPLWKRLAAELIDFSLMFFIKLIITFAVMETFSIWNTVTALEFLQTHIIENSSLSLDFILELAFLEFLHRFVVCLFEAYYLKGRTCATPGKRFMGLIVVHVETITLVRNRPDYTVIATGVVSLGWQRSICRSILKNLIVALLFPLCITFYVFPFNRISYDMMCKTLVVEAHPEFLLYENLVIR